MYSSFGWKWKLGLGTWRVTGEMVKGKERYNVNWLSRYFAGGWWVGKFENSVCKVFMLLCIRYRWNCEMIAKGDTNTLSSGVRAFRRHAEKTVEEYYKNDTYVWCTKVIGTYPVLVSRHWSVVRLAMRNKCVRVGS